MFQYFFKSCDLCACSFIFVVVLIFTSVCLFEHIITCMREQIICIQVINIRQSSQASEDNLAFSHLQFCVESIQSLAVLGSKKMGQPDLVIVFNFKIRTKNTIQLPKNYIQSYVHS